KELRAELESATESLTRLLGAAALEVERAQDALGDYARRQRLANVDFNSSSSELFRALELLSQHELDRAREEARLSAAERRQRARPSTPLPFLSKIRRLRVCGSRSRPLE